MKRLWFITKSQNTSPLKDKINGFIKLFVMNTMDFSPWFFISIIILALLFGIALVAAEDDALNIVKFAKEGEKVEIKFLENDTKGSPIEYSSSNLPSGAVLSGSTFIWDLPYHAAMPEISPTRKFLFQRGLIKKINLDARERFDIIIQAKSESTTQTKTVTIYVENVNRAPTVDAIPNLIEVKAGERLNIPLQGSDPDKDILQYKLSKFVRRNNKKMGPKDVGEHVQKVSVSDGVLKASKNIIVKVIAADTVNKKSTNRKPRIIMKSRYHVKENQTLTIPLIGLDPDKDDLTYSVKGIEGMKVVNNAILEYTPSFDVVKGVAVKKENATITVKDKEEGIEKNISIDVINVNRIPTIKTSSPVDQFITRRGEVVAFSVDVEDPDGDNLTYLWKPAKQKKLNPDYAHVRQLLLKGKKKMKVVISDGKSKLKKEWEYIVR